MSQPKEEAKQDFFSYTPATIFTYSIDHLSPKDKVRFYYALKGRNGKSGIVSRLGIRYLGHAVLLVVQHFAPELASFLEEWKCSYEKIEVLVKK